MELATALDFVRDHRNGILITLKADGRPQSSNIVYRVVDDRIEISLTADRAKTKNLRRDPRVSLHVNRDDFWAYAVVEGEAHLSPTAEAPDDETVDRLVDYYRSMVGEHDDWDEYRRAMVDDRRLVLTIEPTRAYGMLSR